MKNEREDGDDQAVHGGCWRRHQKMKFASKGQRLRRDAVEAHSTRPRALLAAILSLMLFRPFILVMLFAAGGAIAASPWIEDVTVRATSEQFHKAKNVVSDGGLAETPAGSGVWKLSANAFLSGGTMWASGSSAHGPDEQPLIEFDLGVPRIVAGFHVWNYNEKNYTGRGFRDRSEEQRLNSSHGMSSRMPSSA